MKICTDEIAVDNTGRVYVLQTPLDADIRMPVVKMSWVKTYEDLVEEVLDELLLEGARSEQSVQVGTEELGDKIAARR